MGVTVALLGGGGPDAVRQARAAGAEVVCLPQLSFLPYLPAVRDRGGLEHAERPVARSYRDALDAADGAWLAASAYESEGEGVFYATAMLGRAATCSCAIVSAGSTPSRDGRSRCCSRPGTSRRAWSSCPGARPAC